MGKTHLSFNASKSGILSKIMGVRRKKPFFQKKFSFFI